MLSAQLGRLSLATDASNAGAFSRAGPSAINHAQNSTPGKQQTPAFAPSKLHGRLEVHAATLVAEFGDQRSSKLVNSRRSSFDETRKDSKKDHGRDLPDFLQNLMNPNIEPKIPQIKGTSVTKNDNAALDRLISALGRHRATWQRSLLVYCWLRDSGHEFDDRLCASLIRICAKHNAAGKALEIYEWMRRSKRAGGAGLNGSVFTYTAAMRAAIVDKQLDYALDIWQHALVSIPDEIDCQISTVLIEALDKKGENRRALETYRELKAKYANGCGGPLTVHTYTAAIHAASSSPNVCKEDILEIWNDMKKNKIKPSAHAYTVMISAHGSLGMWRDSISLFDEMILGKVQPDVVSCTALVDALASNGQWEKAEKMVMWMKQRRIMPNVRTYSALITSYAESRQWSKASTLLDQMKKGALGNGNKPNAYTYSLLIRSLADKGMWKKAEKIFAGIEHVVEIQSLEENVIRSRDTAKRQRENDIGKETVPTLTLVSKRVAYDSVQVDPTHERKWTSQQAAVQGITLDIHNQAHQTSTQQAIKRRGKESTLNVVVCGAMMYAYEKSGCWEKSLEFLDRCGSLGITPNTILYNTALSALAKNGQVVKAQNLFSLIQCPDNVTYETMIACYGLAGMPREAESMLKEMMDNGFRPRDYALCGLVAGWSTFGSVNKALNVANRAHELGVKPSVHLYNALIACCDRFQKYEKAVAFLEEMRRLNIQGNAITHNLAISVCTEGLRNVESQQAAFTAISAAVVAAGTAMIRAGIF
eukprot:jgi/Picsp_1/67/NSC_00067-R1_pentatricopeptide repeat-containing protein